MDYAVRSHMPLACRLLAQDDFYAQIRGSSRLGVATYSCHRSGKTHRRQSRPVRGSIVEDRAAKQLLEAGDARLDADEATKAVEIWKSVIERYPRSRHRFDAHLRLGNYYLDR